MRKSVVAALAALTVTVSAGAAQAAATLQHAYSFATSAGGYVLDTVGTANGQLLGDANVAGGYLNLDGAGDYVQFGENLIPTAGGAFSLLLTVKIAASQAGIAEIISQGFSGGHGFYVGTDGGSGFRLSDAYGAPNVALPSAGAFHNLFLTNGDDGFKFYIDGALAFTGAKVNTFNVDTHTRLGRQFGGYGEYLNGQIDQVKIYSGVATYAAATGSGAPEPASWGLMILGFFGAGALLRRRGGGGLPALFA